MIPCIKATALPEDVLDYLCDLEISTHYQNDVALIGNDCDKENNIVGGNNLLLNWLYKEYGYKIKNKDWGDYIAIIAT